MFFKIRSTCMIIKHKQKQESPLSAPKTYRLHKQGIEKQNWPAKRLSIVALPHSKSVLEIQLSWKTCSFVFFEFWHRPRSQLLHNGLLFVRRHFFLQKAFLKGDAPCHHQLEHSSKNQYHGICS